MAQKRIKKSGKVKKVVKEKEEKPKGQYHMTVLLGGNTFETDTDDLKASILALKPQKIVNKVIVRIKRGDSKIEKVLFVYPARRIFNIPLATEFFVKNMILALK